MKGKRNGVERIIGKLRHKIFRYRDLLRAEGRSDHHREMAQRVKHVHTPQISRIQTPGSRSLLHNIHCPEYAGDDIISEGGPYTRDTNLKSGTSIGGRSRRAKRSPYDAYPVLESITVKGTSMLGCQGIKRVRHLLTGGTDTATRRVIEVVAFPTADRSTICARTAKPWGPVRELVNSTNVLRSN